MTAYYTDRPNELIYKIGVNNGAWNRVQEKVVDGYTFGKGTDITSAHARCDDKGNCGVQFWWYPEGNYVVMDTDYTSYALVYGCDNWFGIAWTDQAWILSRTKELEQTKIDSATKTLEAYAFWYDHKTQWLKQKQGGDCQYVEYDP